MSNRKTIQEITKPHINRTKGMNRSSDEIPYAYRGKVHVNHKAIITRSCFIILILVAIAFIVITTTFVQATIYVVLEKQVTHIEGEYTAYRENSETNTGNLPFTLKKLHTETARETLTAQRQKDIRTSATGKVIIKNNQTEKALNLRVGTRFQTPEGLLYRSQKALTVPGYNADGTPGVLEVIVVADEAGESFNISSGTLRLPGFQEAGENDYYDNIHAEVSTPFVGGFSGVRYVIDEDIEANIKSKLRSSLDKTLRGSVDAFLEEGEIYFDNTVFIEYTTLESNYEGVEITYREQGEVYALIFNEKQLAQFLFQETNNNSLTYPTHIENTNELILTLNEDIDYKNDPLIIFNINGNTTLQWDLSQKDREQIKDDVAGISKNVIFDIVNNYPQIKSATVKIFPTWKSTIPNNTNKITIQYNNN